MSGRIETQPTGGVSSQDDVEKGFARHSGPFEGFEQNEPPTQHEEPADAAAERWKKNRPTTDGGRIRGEKHDDDVERAFDHWLNKQPSEQGYVTANADPATEPSDRLSPSPKTTTPTSSQGPGSQAGPSRLHDRSIHPSRRGTATPARQVPRGPPEEPDEPQDSSPLTFEPLATHQEASEGPRFYRISKALPWLLCTEDRLHILEVIHQDQVKNNFLKYQVRRELRITIGPMDRMVLGTLMIAANPLTLLAPLVLQNFKVDNGVIKLWKDVGDRAPEEIEVSFKPYMKKVLQWQSSFAGVDIVDCEEVCYISQRSWRMLMSFFRVGGML